MREKLSKTDKIALARLSEGEFTSSMELAEEMGIDRNYANNILTKLKRLGHAKKQWVTEYQVVISAITPNDRWAVANIINLGALEAVVPSRVRKMMLDISFRLSPSYIPVPELIESKTGFWCRGCKEVNATPVCSRCGTTGQRCITKVYKDFTTS